MKIFYKQKNVNNQLQPPAHNEAIDAVLNNNNSTSDSSRLQGYLENLLDNPYVKFNGIQKPILLNNAQTNPLLFTSKTW